MAEMIARQSGAVLARASFKRTATFTAWLAPCALFLIALAPRILLAWQNGFDGLYGQDAYAYYGYAKQMYSALSSARLPPPFWWPLGYPALLNFGFLVLGTSIRSAQVTTTVSGALVAPLTFMLARDARPDLRGNLAGLIAGGIVALSGQSVQSSMVIMSDAPALVWATLGAWLLVRYSRSKRARTLALSAAAVGLSVITRWENLGFALPWVTALVCTGFIPDRDASIPWHRRLVKIAPHLLIALGILAVFVLPQLVYQIENAAPLAGQSWLEGWSPINTLARSVDTIDGHFDYSLPIALFYSQVFFHPAYLFPLLTPFLLIGARQFVKNSRIDPSTNILLAGWIALPYLFLVGIPYENFRFGLGFFVPVSVMAGTGAAWAWGRIDEISFVPPRIAGGSSSSRTVRTALLALLAVSFAGTASWEPRVLAPVLAEKQNELSYTSWLNMRLPPSATLYTFGMTEALNAYSSKEARDLSEESPDRIAADVRANAPSFLFVDVANIETQWRGRVLQQNLHALRDQVGLAELGNIGRFTLFHIGAPQ